MVARWPGAFLLSSFLHGAIIAVIVLLGWAVVQPERPNTIITLVGKVGDAGQALADSPVPALRVALTQGTRPVTSEPVAATRTADPVRSERARPTQARSDSTPRQREVGPISADRDRSKPVALQTRMTKTGFDARQGGRSASAPVARSVPRAYVDGTGIAGELKAEANAVKRGDGATGGPIGPDSYLGRLEAALGAAIEGHPGLLDAQTAVAEYHILADGRLTDVRLVTRSADPEFNRVLIETIRGFAAGPRPTGVPEVHRTAFHTRAR